MDIHLLSIIIFFQSLAARRYSFCVHFLIIFLRLFDIDQVIVAFSHHYRSVNEVICHGIPDARYMFSVFYFFASSVLSSEIILLKNVIVVTLLDWGFYVKLWLNFLTSDLLFQSFCSFFQKIIIVRYLVVFAF